jgi:hypothetical protein
VIMIIVVNLMDFLVLCHCSKQKFPECCQVSETDKSTFRLVLRLFFFI